MNIKRDTTLTIEYSIAAGIGLSGLFLVITCLPISYIAATFAGKDPIVSVLLLQSRADILAFLTKPSLSEFGYTDLSVISALLALYGILPLLAPLVFQVAKRGGYVKLLTLTYGMILGLALTAGWFEWSNSGRIDWFAPSTPEIAYIYLAFLIAESGKLVLEHKGIVAIPYFYAIDGIFGIVAVLIIHAGYAPSFSSLLLGPFFLVAVAAAIIVSEWIFLRPATVLFLGMGLAMTDSAFERRFRAVSGGALLRHKLLLRQIAAKVGETRAMAYPERVKLIERALSKGFRMLPRRTKKIRSIRLDPRVVAGSFAGSLFFPIMAGIVAWLLF